ncbi:MAG: hypothetical protein ACI8W7_000627 [Gammaproteobacteria bacterium]|jgi:uncharacterized protein YdbL (DUF1318 family)
MLRTGWLLTTMGVLALSACVTINVYFPAAAAEKAADRIIDEVWGEQTDERAKPAVRGAVHDPSRQLAQREVSAPLRKLMFALLDVLIPTASAQANLDVSTPAVNALQSSMSTRHSLLAPFYNSGAIGVTDEGLVAVRDAKALSLQDRPKANNLVAEENRDRNNLYQAIAQANGHPEWEPNIRATFARRWIERAKTGWWYESRGAWRKR